MGGQGRKRNLEVTPGQLDEGGTTHQDRELEERGVDLGIREWRKGSKQCCVRDVPRVPVYDSRSTSNSRASERALPLTSMCLGRQTRTVPAVSQWRWIPWPRSRKEGWEARVERHQTVGAWSRNLRKYK